MEELFKLMERQQEFIRAKQQNGQREGLLFQVGIMEGLIRAYDELKKKESVR